MPRAPHTERRPPLGHEATSAPLTAPALVKLQVKEASPEPEPSQVTPESPKPFLRHKDSVDLISPPASPRLHSKTEERPNPIGKVSSTLTVTLKSPAPSGPVSPTESGGRRRLVEARSSALIRRWTVGERVLIQPRRPVLDAPEIVPLNLQPSKQSMGLEPRELAGQPDGEDSTMPSEPAPISTSAVVEPPLKAEPEKIVPVNRVEDFIEIRVRDKADQPPTPPSSPLPDEDTPGSKTPGMWQPAISIPRKQKSG
ncbi:hypothetical protein B566_EDAN011519 [Ephemera danica]|nr:hypothetical protein B566_EDAN011519 [Ephemera danica]